MDKLPLFIAIGFCAAGAAGFTLISGCIDSSLRSRQQAQIRDSEYDPENALPAAATTPAPDANTAQNENIQAHSPSPSPSAEPEATPQAEITQTIATQTIATQTVLPADEPQAAAESGGYAIPEDALAGAREAFGREVVYVTLLGIDSDDAREKKGRGYRSDVIMLAALNTKTGGCALLSIPRDTRASMTRLNKKGAVSANVRDKLNAAYGYGGGPGGRGAQNALSAISGLTGLELEYYATIDMDGIVPLADAVGGVEVTLEDSVPGVGKKGETVLLKGENAYTFVRKRKGVTGGSDIARIGRQQQFMTALAKKVQSSNPIKMVPAIVTAMSGELETNMGIGQLLAIANALRGLDMDEAKAGFYTLPGRSKTINGKSYYICSEKDAHAFVKEKLWGGSNG